MQEGLEGRDRKASERRWQLRWASCCGVSLSGEEKRE